MGHRVVEVSSPSYLTKRNKHLVIERDATEVGRVPIEDLGVLILDSCGIVLTQELIIACATENVAVITCDEKHLPLSVNLPFYSHSLHAKVLREQVAAAEPAKKRVWQSLVQAKIAGQADTLKKLNLKDTTVRSLVQLVRSGDPDNVEGRAASLYWDELFGTDFIRDRDEIGINSWLNYGYAILRAMTARALVATGLHPALGVHHRNQFNPMALADDVMEPFRPLVDFHVAKMAASGEFKGEASLTPTIKRHLLTFTVLPVKVTNKSTLTPLAITMYAAILKAVLVGEKRKLLDLSLF